MLKLVTLLQSLKAQPRQLTAEEDLFLNAKILDHQ